MTNEKKSDELREASERHAADRARASADDHRAGVEAFKRTVGARGGAKAPKPHPLAGINTELDALAAAAPIDAEEYGDDGGITEAERALFIAAAETFIRGMRKGASVEDYSSGVRALNGLSVAANGLVPLDRVSR